MADNGDLVRAALRHGVSDKRVIQAMKAIDRRYFVEQDPDSMQNVYRYMPLAIAEEQTTSQPSLIAMILEALAIQPHERVLEIGTGYGYQTALLSQLCRDVVSIERLATLADRARENLAACGIGNVTVIHGDGGLGVPEQAPWDVIIVSAATPAVPPPLVAQLCQGGRIVIPLGPGGDERVVLYRKSGSGLSEERVLTAARYVRMIGAYAHGE